jgi:hypothetical protein
MRAMLAFSSRRVISRNSGKMSRNQPCGLVRQLLDTGTIDPQSIDNLSFAGHPSLTTAP